MTIEQSPDHYPFILMFRNIANILYIIIQAIWVDWI